MAANYGLQVTVRGLVMACQDGGLVGAGRTLVEL